MQKTIYEKMVGEKFGFLSVLHPIKINGRTKLRCKCDCGNEVIRYYYDIYSGKTTSCGCAHSAILKGRNVTHGMCGRRVYRSWIAMKNRCLNKNYKQYHNYGGRGISVCQRWVDSFENFFEDMGSPPKNHYQLDRIDNNGNYEKSNCRWVPPKINSRNSSWPKLSYKKAMEIRKRYKTECITHRQLAAEYGVQKAAITKLLNNWTWT